MIKNILNKHVINGSSKINYIDIESLKASIGKYFVDMRMIRIEFLFLAEVVDEPSTETTRL
jgi:hypothetical protein